VLRRRRIVSTAYRGVGWRNPSRTGARLVLRGRCASEELCLPIFVGRAHQYSNRRRVRRIGAKERALDSVLRSGHLDGGRRVGSGAFAGQRGDQAGPVDNRRQSVRRNSADRPFYRNRVEQSAVKASPAPTVSTSRIGIAGAQRRALPGGRVHAGVASVTTTRSGPAAAHRCATSATESPG